MKQTIFVILIACLLSGFTVGCGKQTDAKSVSAGTGIDVSSETESVTDSVLGEIKNQDMQEDKHLSEEDYKAEFQTHMLSVAPFTLHMENGIYDEIALREAAKKLLSDISALENTTEEKPEAVTVYLVSSTPDGCPKIAGNRVFCSLENFESGAYRETLVGAVYNLPCAWQRAGLTELVFGGKENINLKDYYADSAHMLTASCSAIHLSHALADEETVLAARQTAKSLTAFVLDTKDFSVFRETTNPGELLSNWSNSLGISPVPNLPTGSADAAELTIGMKKGAVCELKVNNLTVTITESSWLLDSDGLYKWFCSFFAGMDMVLEQIAQEAPSALAIAERRYSEPVSIIFGDSNSATYTYPAQNRILLTREDAIWHEMVHLLLEENVVRKEQEWIEEALAEHFSYVARTHYAPTRYYSENFEAYLRFFEEVSGKEAEADDMVFHQQVWDLYQTFRTETDIDDTEAYCRAYGTISLITEGKLKRTQVRMLYDRSIASKRGQEAGEKKYGGSALNYPEAVVLLEYLGDKYGMDALIEAFVNGNSLETTFGISYPELYQAAIDYYAQQYVTRCPSD